MSYHPTLFRPAPIAVLLIVSVMLAISGCSSSSSRPPTGANEPDSTNGPFASSDFQDATQCATCHPDHYAQWSGSMHAYSLTDPVFAAVRAEGQSMYIGALDGACAKCHSPIGNRAGDLPWGPFTLSALEPVVAEGIGCDMCHTIHSISRTSNAGFELAPSETKYGTIANPVPNSFHESEYQSLYADPVYCGSCHDFITGDGLHLEVAFREWREGGFAQTGKTCGDCHMPTYQGQAAVGGPTRTLHDHRFIGADVALIDFPNKPEQMAAVTQMLQGALVLEATVPAGVNRGETLTVGITVANEATGHNVPTGVPFNREMWLSVVVSNAAGDTLYQSGLLDSDSDIIPDPQLVNYQSTMLRDDSLPTPAVWDARYLINRSIRPGEVRPESYVVPIPAGAATGDYSVDVKLHFRSFYPQLIRDAGLDALLPIPVIDMQAVARTVTVS